VAGGPTTLVDGLALLFVGARLAYVVCYLADLATLRSLVWTVGFLSTLVLFISPVL
jgi:uncharacterized MAPEG superfamily protein